jgi:IS30 family transposase
LSRSRWPAAVVHSRISTNRRSVRASIPRRADPWLPRHLDIDRTSDQDIQEIIVTTNLTPRKCLGFKTPFQALIAELGKDVQIRFS